VQHPSYLESNRITDRETELSNWHATEMLDRTLVFHHYPRPARIWAVEISPGGIVWDEAQIEEITSDRVSVCYKDVRAPLNRQRLVLAGEAWWRGVCFTAERRGWRARWYEQYRREWDGHLPGFREDLDEARRILGLKQEDYTREDILAAFRRAAKRYHPDKGGTAEQFRKLVEARDRLLASIGEKAPPPKEPNFTPSGVRVVYRSVSALRRRIGGGGLRRITHP
jgi:hypothetical protein